jgi:hypothetical protein
MFRDAARTFFASKGWVRKSVLGTLIALIPYVGAFVIYGYGLELNRRVAWATSEDLPDWDQFAVYLKRGFFGYLVAVIYSLPASLITSLLAVPLTIAFGMGANGGASIVAFFIALMVGLVALLLVSSAAVLPFMYSGVINYNLYDTLGKGFAFSEVWARMKANRPRLAAVTWRTVAYTLVITLLVFLVMAPYFAFVVSMMSVIGQPRPVADPNLTLGLLGLQAVFALAYPFIAFGSFVLNQIVWIMWGRYAREAYRLAESPVQPGQAAPDGPSSGAEAPTAAPTSWLPEAPDAPAL